MWNRRNNSPRSSDLITPVRRVTSLRSFHMGNSPHRISGLPGQADRVTRLGGVPHLTVRIDWLPHKGGRPHLPEVSHIHVNRPKGRPQSLVHNPERDFEHPGPFLYGGPSPQDATKPSFSKRRQNMAQLERFGQIRRADNQSHISYFRGVIWSSF